MRALAITGMVTASWMPLMSSGSLMRATPPSRRMSAGTRPSAHTAAAPASSAIFACSASTTSMITPPLSISASPALTRKVDSSRIVIQDSREPAGAMSKAREYNAPSWRPWTTMRILMTSTRGAGHFGPLRVFGDAFRDDGHRVLVALPEQAVELGHSAGHDVWPLPEPDERE